MSGQDDFYYIYIDAEQASKETEHHSKSKGKHMKFLIKKVYMYGPGLQPGRFGATL